MYVSSSSHDFFQMDAVDAVESRPRDDARLHAMVLSRSAFIARSLRRLGVPVPEIDDALQQVFLVASRRLEDIRPDAERAFLFATALRVAADMRRSARTRPEVADDDMFDIPASSRRGADQLLEQARARALLDGLLAELPSELREVFVLFELEELATPGIAARLGIPVGTAASRLRRARACFEEAIKRHQARGQSSSRFASGVFPVYVPADAGELACGA